MMNKKMSSSTRNESTHPVQPKTETGEYGIEQVMASSKNLANARKHSGYHFSHDELEHKCDRVDEQRDND
jgi:hypothetical protein